MGKKRLSLLVVDLSTSFSTAGTRMIPLTNYFLGRSYGVSYLVNQGAWKKYRSLLGKNKTKKVSVKIFPFSKRFPDDKILIILEVLKKIILSPFIKVNRKIDFIYSLTGIICDVFPSFIYKIFYGKFWVANVDNLEAPPAKKPGPYLINLISFLAFRASVFFLRFADLVFITTPLNEVKETLVKGGISPQKIILSDNGIPLENIGKIKPGQKKGYAALFLGRIHEGKGVFDLVNVWRVVSHRWPKIGRLVLLGSGDQETIGQLRKLIKEKDLVDKVILLGFVDGREKYRFLKSSQIFLFPSYYDANPGAVKEALACGLPVVAYDLPIFTEHYPRGLIQTVPRGDISGFTEQVLAILKDDSGRKQLGKRGKRYAKKFNWLQIFKKQEKFMLALFEKNEKKQSSS